MLVIALGCFFIADIVTGFGFHMPKRAPASRAAALVVLMAVATLNALRPPVVR